MKIILFSPNTCLKEAFSSLGECHQILTPLNTHLFNVIKNIREPVTVIIDFSTLMLKKTYHETAMLLQNSEHAFSLILLTAGAFFNKWFNNAAQVNIDLPCETVLKSIRQSQNKKPPTGLTESGYLLHLSRRQVSVLYLILTGYSRAQIALILGIEIKTVYSHCYILQQRLHCRKLNNLVYFREYILNILMSRYKQELVSLQMLLL